MDKKEQQFKVGDTVRLKSGGPLMTVQQIVNGIGDGPDIVDAIWLDSSLSMQTTRNFARGFAIDLKLLSRELRPLPRPRSGKRTARRIRAR